MVWGRFVALLTYAVHVRVEIQNFLLQFRSAEVLP